MKVCQFVLIPIKFVAFLGAKGGFAIFIFANGTKHSILYHLTTRNTYFSHFDDHICEITIGKYSDNSLYLISAHYVMLLYFKHFIHG